MAAHHAFPLRRADVVARELRGAQHLPGADTWHTLLRAATDTREQEEPPCDDLRLERDTLEAELLQAQEKHDLVLHELPMAVTDVSDTGVTMTADELRNVGDTAATLEMPPSGSHLATQPPETPARAVAPGRHWHLLGHPQLQELGAPTAEDLDAALDAAREGDPAFRVGRAYAHIVDLPGGCVFQFMLLKEITADLTNFGWTLQDIDELEAALFEHLDPTERAELIRALGASAGAAERPPCHSKKSRKSGR